MQIKDYAAELVEPNHAPLSAILRPEDEIQLWSDLAASSTCPVPLQQRAATLSALFAPISPKLAALRRNSGRLPTEDVLDLIDELHQTLEALWEVEDATAPGQQLDLLPCHLTLHPLVLLVTATRYATKHVPLHFVGDLTDMLFLEQLYDYN